VTKPLNEALLEAARLLQATIAIVATSIYAIPFNSGGCNGRGVYHLGIEDVV
jgi:hypothetical protein